MEGIRLAVVTVSDGVFNGKRTDRSGNAIVAWAGDRGHRVIARECVPDDSERISSVLLISADRERADLILTTGGTGFTARDVTPEATLAVLERGAPGIPEAIRIRGSAVTPYAWLSRGVAGIRGRTLIVNLPGSESGVRDGLAVLDEIAGHAIQLIRGTDTDRHEPADG